MSKKKRWGMSVQHSTGHVFPAIYLSACMSLRYFISQQWVPETLEHLFLHPANQDAERWRKKRKERLRRERGGKEARGEGDVRRRERAEFASDVFGILNEGFSSTSTHTVQYISLHQSYFLSNISVLMKLSSVPRPSLRVN